MSKDCELEKVWGGAAAALRHLIITTAGMMTMAKPMAGPGAHGFSEKGEFDFSVGSLRGLRLWDLEAAGQLRGSFGAVWADGENVAACAKAEEMKGLILVLATERAFLHWCHDQRISPQDPRIRRVSDPDEMLGFPEDTRWIEVQDGFVPLQHLARLRKTLSIYAKADYHRTRDRLRRPDNPHAVPGPNGECGCGFWAYWTPEYANGVFRPGRPVMGVVEGYGRTRIGDRGFRAEKARIVAVSVMFDWSDDPGGQLRSLTEMRIEDRYPSVKVYDTLDCMIAMHPPTRDYLPEPPAPRTAEFRVPQLMCPAGLPLGTIERNILPVTIHPAMDPMNPRMVSVRPDSELKAWHADGSVCEHLVRFLASGGKATIVHDKGKVTISYGSSGLALAPGGGGSWSAPANVTAPRHPDTGWRPVVPSANFDQALDRALTYHPDGRPRITGGNSTVKKFP